MELFIPGLIVLVLTALFAFLVIPRTGPTILMVVSLVALIAAGVHHYSFFHGEYTLSTWQNGLAAYAPFIVLGLALVFVLAAISFLFSSPETKAAAANALSTPMEAIQEKVANAAAAMPSAASATNPVTAAVNSGLAALGVGGAAAAAGAGAAAAPVPANYRNRNRANANKSPLIPGLPFSASEI